jgi:hypothetical protein
MSGAGSAHGREKIIQPKRRDHVEDVGVDGRIILK